MSSATSSAFSKASAHALSFCSASEASSPFSGPTSVDRHGFFKSSHRVGGPALCSLPGRVTTFLPSRFRQISRTAEERTRDILQHLSLEFISVHLVGRLSKASPETEPVFTILVAMPDQPNPETWYSAVRRIHSELQRDAPDISVELIEQKLCAVREHNPVTVIVQVVKTSTNPFTTAARDLHGILALFDQENVDVLFRRDTSKPFMEDCYVPVKACAGAVLPGFSLGIHQCSAGSSTLGGFVQLQFANDSQWHTFALTCFHAVWPPANHRDVKRLTEIPDALRALQHWEFRPLDPRDPRSFPDVARRILCVDHPSLRDLNNTIDRGCAIAASMRTTPQFLDEAKYEAILRRIKATEDACSPFIAMRESGNHFLGHVYAGSGLHRVRSTVRSNTDSKKETHEIPTDWALIAINPSRLQPQQHGDCVSGNMPFPYRNDIQFSGAWDQPITEPFIGPELQKSGRSSQITCGTYSELKCVMFTQVRDDHGQIAIVPTWEHKIASSRKGDFAENGDSGSWVFNLSGELVGMLKGGDEAYGTGAMTLMVDIFDDIQSITGATKVRVAPAPVP
ncbi:hypothetical protein N7535_006938 [Penicillium sp. DV-2018c]|nr:hypothetical protein N7535_006938 [Penicillium sp. DV-2018c]